MELAKHRKYTSRPSGGVELLLYASTKEARRNQEVLKVRVFRCINTSKSTDSIKETQNNFGITTIYFFNHFCDRIESIMHWDKH